MHRRSLMCLAIPAILAFGLAAPAAPSLAQASTQQAANGGRSNGASVTVTLLTGDRITVTGKEPTGATIEPGAGREHVRFRQYVADGHLHVVPGDAGPALAKRTLDPRLFDVTALVEAGYDDQHSKHIPLIVEGKAAPKHATVRRDLRAVGARAVAVDKRQASAFFKQASTTGKIWLDGKRRLLLDQSVPQIGAPTAWGAGFTGEGTTVAVLDSGIDEGHPDLADAVQATKDFTGEGIDDTVGHGTHVASIVTGSGAASGGKYKGVAPDAKLLVGKVCFSDWCDESAILAGMQWAAEGQHADVVNLSIGGPDDPGLDPLEDAVNTLTEQTGTLFVVAAGNEGPADHTISSPGSAEAALTVGAVDKADELAEFSSRGPSPGDSGLKPDLTAPGVGIVAARAEGTEIGTPVDDAYTSLDGTSMATPHVAGAAALLVQQHPDWTAQELKSALTSSAAPGDGLGSFAQGTGRVDLARAISQQIVPGPASLSFGKTAWPHNDDEPVTRRLTYRNDGATDITLNLTAELDGPDGRPAPAGALTLDTGRLTVPAGGTAAVTATVDTSFEGADGAYGGRITATAGDLRLVTAVGVEREGEMYELTVGSVDRTGGPPPIASYSLTGLDNGFGGIWFGSGEETQTFRLPRGRYLLDGLVDTGEGEDSTASLIVRPNLLLDRDTEWTADARLGQPVEVEVERPTAEMARAEVGYQVTTEFGGWGTGVSTQQLDHIFAAQVGPDQPDYHFFATVASSWGELDDNGSLAGSPYVYGVLDYRSGRFWNGYHKAVRDRELARVVSLHTAQTAGHEAFRSLEGGPPGAMPTFRTSWGVALPSRTTLLLSAGPGWEQGFGEFVRTDDGETDLLSSLVDTERVYRPGKTVVERWNAAAFTPGFTGRRGMWAAREGDTIWSELSMYGDQNGHAGSTSALDSWSTALYRDGEKVADGDWFGMIWADGLPATPADYRLTLEADRSSAFDLSTKTSSTWEFRSAATESAQPLPLWVARYAPAVDDHNRVPARPHGVPMRLETIEGAPAGEIESLTVRISTDDGATWKRVKPRRLHGNTWLLGVKPPAGSAYVSIDVAASDSNGNRMHQTTMHAYALK
ncbi:S8 family peptidase [Flindersiella endophytica]